MPLQAVALCPAKFKDNMLHLSVGFCAGMMQNVSGHFGKGAKVYPLKIDVNVGKEKISFQVVGCKVCNHANVPFPHKAEVVFEFDKGYLEKASASEVEDIIGQVFTITTEDEQQAQSNGDADQQQAATTRAIYATRAAAPTRTADRSIGHDYRPGAGGSRQAGKNLQRR